MNASGTANVSKSQNTPKNLYIGNPIAVRVICKFEKTDALKGQNHQRRATPYDCRIETF